MLPLECKNITRYGQKDSKLLYFIIVYLLLFYDLRPLLLLTGKCDEIYFINDIKPNSISLYFILIFLILFY